MNLTQILTHNYKNTTKKEGTTRKVQKAEFPYFTDDTEHFGTRQNLRKIGPISNKIPSPRWAVTKVAVHLPFLRVSPRRAHAKHVQHIERGHSRVYTKQSPLSICAHVPSAHVFAEGRDIDGRCSTMCCSARRVRRDCGVLGEAEKEVLDLPPKTVLLKFYSKIWIEWCISGSAEFCYFC